MSEFPRPLTALERAVLDLLLSEPFPGRDELRDQAADVKVNGGCDCGCATVDLLVSGDSIPPAPVLRRVPVEATTTAGPAADVLLHVVNGRLNELEVFRHDGEPAALPDSGILKLR